MPHRSTIPLGREKIFEDSEFKDYLIKNHVIVNDLASNFKIPQTQRNDSNARKLGVVRVVIERFFKDVCFPVNSSLGSKRPMHRIVTVEKKQIHYCNPKHRKPFFYIEA